MERLHLINLCLEHLLPSLGQLAVLHDLCLGRNRLGLHADALPPELTQVRQAGRRQAGGQTASLYVCLCPERWRPTLEG